MPNEYVIRLTREEKDAVLAQLTGRLDALEELMAAAGARKDANRVLQLAEYIKTLRNAHDKIFKGQRV